MHAHPIPYDEIGGTGVFALMADTLSTPPRGSAAPSTAGSLAATMRLMTEADARGNDAAMRGASTRNTPGLPADQHKLVGRFALWLRLGYVGVTAAVVGVLQLFAHEGTPAAAVTLGLAGAVLGVVAWHYGRTTLARIDPAADSAPNTPRVAPTVVGYI